MPRLHASVEEVGPFTLFIGRPGGWPYYARPQLGGKTIIALADVALVLAKMRELQIPTSIEWVHETTPTLLDAVGGEGSLQPQEVPLMVLELPISVEAPANIEIRLLRPSDRDLLAGSQAVQQVGFAVRGTAIGVEGAAERDSALKAPTAQEQEMLANGAIRIAVAMNDTGQVLATGRHIPIGDVTEVVGVATLPSMRRRGLGAAITAALVDDARANEIKTVFLTAGSEEIARVYSRIGFSRVATGYVAERRGFEPIGHIGTKTP